MSVVCKDCYGAKEGRPGKDKLTRNKGFVEKATTVIQPRYDQGQGPGIVMNMVKSLLYILLQAQS